MLRDTLKRMDTELKDIVNYTLDIHGEIHHMNTYVGKQVKRWNVGPVVSLIIGTGLAFWITVLNIYYNKMSRVNGEPPLHS